MPRFFDCHQLRVSSEHWVESLPESARDKENKRRCAQEIIKRQLRKRDYKDRISAPWGNEICNPQSHWRKN